MIKNYSLFLFIAVALVQLYIPAKMIFDNEMVIESGTVYKFKTAPIDPVDPFRGRYVLLSFEANRFPVSNAEEWNSNEEVFVEIHTDEQGFSKIAGVSKEIPSGNLDFIKARINWVNFDTIPEIIIEYPFSKFYMEESKAYKAEQAVVEAARDSNSVTYAVVSIKNGTAVLTDVMINNQSLKILAGEIQE